MLAVLSYILYFGILLYALLIVRDMSIISRRARQATSILTDPIILAAMHRQENA